jgi:hypothetical protein
VGVVDPPTDPHLAPGRFWTTEPEPSLAPYFSAVRAAQASGLKDPKGDLNSEVTKAGATELEPATSGVTGPDPN